MITGKQCWAARILVEISRDRLAQRTGIDAEVIANFEQRIQMPGNATLSKLRSELEELGASFVPDDGAMGAGVRLKFSKSLTRRIDVWEGEGGTSDLDDVQ